MEKFTKGELFHFSVLLRGRRDEIAKRANVSRWTVNNTFQDVYQNEKVLEVVAEMIEEQNKKEVKSNPLVDRLRNLVSS